MFGYPVLIKAGTPARLSACFKNYLESCFDFTKPELSKSPESKSETRSSASSGTFVCRCAKEQKHSCHAKLGRASFQMQTKA